MLATFQYFGGPGANTIRVTGAGASLSIVVDGVGSFVPDLPSTRIEIFGQAGDDRIIIDGNGQSEILLDGGLDSDRISLAYDTLATQLDAINGSLTLAGGTGQDSLDVGDVFHNPALDQAFYDLSPSTLQRTSDADSTPVYQHSGFEEISIYTSRGAANQVALENGFTRTFVYGGLLNDELLLGTGTSRLALDNRALIAFAGNNGIDRVVIDDRLETIGDDWVIDSGAPTPTTTYVTKDFGDFGGLNTTDVETFRIEAGSGANSFVVNTTPAPGISFDIRGNENNDQVLLAERTGKLSDLPSQVTFRGGAGSDRLKMTDVGNLTASSYDFTLATIDYPGFGSAVIDAVETVQLDAGNGDSSIVVRETGAGVGTSINGFAGNDTVFIGNDDYDNFINGRITVNGNSGMDAVIFEDDLDAAASDVYGITATTFAKTFGQPTTYGTIEAMTINASDNADTIDFFSIDPLTVVSVMAGAGNDVIRIGSGANGQQANFKPSFAINGEGGTDSLTIHNPGSTTDDLFLIDNDSVLLALPVSGAPIGYSGIESMLINDGSGNSAFILTGLLSTTSVTVLGNNGNDQFRNALLTGLNDDLGQIDGPVTFTGGNGNDTVTLSDTVFGTNAYAVSASSVTRPGFGGINVGTIELLSLRGQSGDNVFNVTDTPPAITQLFGNNGNDTFNVTATNPLGDYLQIHGDAGLDTVTVNTDSVGSALVEFVENEDLASLIIRSGGRLRLSTSLIDTQVLTVEGLLDLADGSLIARGDAASPGEDAYRLLLLAGYAGGAWNGLEPAIRSQTAATTPIVDAIGYARAGDIGTTLFQGTSVSANDLLMRRTIPGDTDLNRVVNFDDLLRTAQNYDNTQTGRFWSDGDFNYNGIANFDDLLAQAQNYGVSLFATPGLARRILLDELR